MKKVLILAVAAILLAACGASSITPEEKAARKQAKQQEVLSLIKNRHWVMNARTMHSSLSGSKDIDFTYGVTIKGDTIISNLPYVGKTHNLVYGNDAGLNFVGAITEYRLDRPQKDANRVQMVVAYDQNLYLYNFLIYDDGIIQLVVSSRNKEAIGFDGEIARIKDNDK